MAERQELSRKYSGMAGPFTRVLQRCLPLWTFRAMPYSWCRWIFRAELARGAEAAKRITWQ
jgi:hypothetical protein